MEKIKKICYGGDYNPEQWPEEIWKEDMRLFKLAHIDIVTLNVFSWAMLQPDEATYDFTKLDKIMDMVEDNHLKVCLATSTAVHCNLLEYLTQRDIQTKNSGVNVRYRGKHRFFKGFNEFIKEKTRRCDNDFEKIERHVFF